MPLTASEGDQRMLGGLPISTQRFGPSNSHCFVVGLFPGWLLSIYSLPNTVGSKEPDRAPILKKLTVYLGDRQISNFSKRRKRRSLRKCRVLLFCPLAITALPSTCLTVGGQQLSSERIQSLSTIGVSQMPEIPLLGPRNLRHHDSPGATLHNKSCSSVSQTRWTQPRSP